MAFCPNCGSAVEGNFCAKCGAAVGLGSDPAMGSTVPPPPRVSSVSGMADNVAGALSYIPIIGVIFLLIEPYNRNRTIRFHAFQSLFLLAAAIVVNILISALTSMMWSLYFLYALVRLAFAVIWLYLMFKTYTGVKVVLPVIGPLAEKQA